MKFYRIFWFALVILFLATFFGCKQFEKTSKGEKQYIIVTANEASDHELKAANVLLKYLQKITDTQFQVLTEHEYRKGQGIYIGHTSFAQRHQIDFEALQEDGFSFKTVGTDFIIAGGNEKGTLYGVYAFLEELGCRKYTSEATVVPKINPLVIEIEDRTEVPRIKFREVLYTDAYSEEFFDWHKLDAHRNSWGSWCHTFGGLVPAEQYAESNPEYYALVNGKRQFGSQLCLSNPDVLRILSANLKKEMEAHPEFDYWSVSQNDNTNFCTCDKCRALDEKEGGPTASVLHFVNQVAKQFPDKTISTLAYQYSRSVPKNLRPEPNVNIMLCNIESQRHLPVPITDPAFSNDLKNWGELTDNIIVWDYIIQFKNLVSPFPNLYTIKPNINFLVENNVTALFEQGNREVGGEMAELRTWLTAKLMWDPDADDQELINEFLDGYYGNAGKFIGTYVELQHQQMIEKEHKLGIFGNPVQAKNTYLSEENMKRYNDLFDQAEAVVEDDPELLERVKICRLPLMYATLEIARTELDNTRSLYLKDENGRLVPKNEIKQLLDEFIDLCNKQGVTRLKEWSTTPDEYHASYSRLFDKIDRDIISINKKVVPITQPSKKYEPLGIMALTNGMFGSYDFAVNWLGYQGEHMDFVLDLGETTQINSISIDFLQGLNDWILLPSYVQFEVSENGQDYTIIEKIQNQNPENKKGIFIQTFKSDVNKRKARYVRVHAQSLINCPEWHLGAGGPVWIFADEIIVR